VDQEYFNLAIAPQINALPNLVEFVGEVDDVAKDQLLGGAYACLAPIDWPEPFGLAMAESMATGTPVIATRVGSVPEVVAHGRTGFVADTLHDLAEAIPRVRELDRRACRAHVERHFSPSAMADGYEAAYAAVIAANHAPTAGGHAAWPPAPIIDESRGMIHP
jgi:glycosyltransferase involved in cell wall biosynthesis